MAIAHFAMLLSPRGFHLVFNFRIGYVRMYLYVCTICSTYLPLDLIAIRHARTTLYIYRTSYIPRYHSRTNAEIRSSSTQASAAAAVAITTIVVMYTLSR